MKQYVIGMAAMAAMSAAAQPAATPVVNTWGQYTPVALADRSLFFDTRDEGVSLPILWGFDTAWCSKGNMLRGIRFATPETIGLARVSFQPWAEITEKGVLPSKLLANLNARMDTVALIGHPVDIVLNLDGGDPTIKEIYGGYKYENPDDAWHSPKEYIGNVVEQGPKWADLIDATAAAVEAKGYKVVTASPLNEPDLELNGTPIELFYEIAKNLKDYEKYPRFRDIRISGGNTLNNDEAWKWYEYNREFLDEGNTHQLAGSFDTYAEFFTKVREDGRVATADELHNVMEAMVGVEYGMQNAIWWGTAEQARGEFMKASFGKRLGYAENRTAWSAASVYRAPSGKVQAFLGCSERQARPSTYKLIGASGDFYVDGKGPFREYIASLPADPNGEYQTTLQRNAETVLNITTGADIAPAIAGEYMIVNKASSLALGGRGGEVKEGAIIEQQSYAGSAAQNWAVNPVREDIGGDFSFYMMTSTDGKMAMDNYNLALEAGSKVTYWGKNEGAQQQWALEYDGEGWFHIRNKQSAYYLECAAGSGQGVVQNDRKDADTQKWRFIPVGAPIEFDAPNVPAGLTAKANTSSVALNWDAVQDGGEVSYTVLRAAKDGDYNTIARGISGTSFLDNGVTEGEYSYEIYAEDASGNRSAHSTAATAELTAKGLVARFPFTENLEDVGENGFSLKSTETINFRRGLYFRGQQWSQLPYNMCDRTKFTIAFNLTNSYPGAVTYKAFSTGYDDSHQLYFIPNENGNSKLVAVNGVEKAEILSTAIEYGNTSHCAITLEDGKVRLYIDGVEAPESISSGIPESRVLTYLGRGQVADASYYVGYMQDLRVYNYALTADQIAALASGESAVEEVASGASREVVAVEYYTPAGVRLAEPATNGITIIRTHYSDGSVSTKKLMK